MMKLSKALMLSVSGLIFTSNGSAASIHNLTSFNSPGAVTFVHTPYTHTSHPDETLLSSSRKRNTSPLRGEVGLQSRTGEGDNKNIQLAATCFVTDTSVCSGNEFGGNNADDDGHGAPGGPGGDDYDLDNAERCRQEGYTQTSCPKGQEPSNTCPYDSDYFEKCVSSCPSNYVTCEVPYYGVGEDCDGKYASCEKDTERACQELNPGYVDECGTGQQLSDDRCSYDSSYGTCCNTCAGYNNTTIPEGYIQDGESCLGCDGQEHYKIKPNPCDGFLDCGSMGPDTGAKSCLSGNQLKYDNCKPCPNLGTLTSCPAPFSCTYEECSGLWYKTGCQSGYDWNSSSQTCTQQCSPDYQYTCSGTGYAGGSGEACGGKYKSCTCADGYEWNQENGTCEEPKPEWGKCNGSAKNCNIGDILYSDGTCASTVVSDKTPIAVVVYKSSDGNCAQAMARESIGNYEWGGYTDVSTLQNFNSESTASQDLASCRNTRVMISDSIKHPAAWAVKNYNTIGTKTGDWCLPAAGIMTSIKNNISTINNGFNLIRGAQIGRSFYYWSSSEAGKFNAWYMNCRYNCELSKSFTKTDSSEVRPVLEF